MNLVIRLNELSERIDDVEEQLAHWNSHSAENAVALYNGVVEHLARIRTDLSELHARQAQSLLDPSAAGQQVRDILAAERERQRALDRRLKHLTIRLAALGQNVAEFRPVVEGVRVLLAEERMRDRAFHALAARVAILERPGFWRRLWRRLTS